jgi:hypothetical protein
MPVLVYTSTVGADPNFVDLVSPQQSVIRTLLQLLTTDLVVESGDAPNPGQSLSETLTQIMNILIAGDTSPGYVARYGYVNAASARLGTMFAGVQLQAAPLIWTDPLHIPPGNVFDWRQWGSAGGSGAGAACRSGSGSASIGGGGPSGGGAMNRWVCTRADLIAALPIAFVTPLGGAGAAQTNGNSVSITSGANGLIGALNSIIGVRLQQTAGGGYFGTGGTGSGAGAGTAGAGGGMLSNATSLSTAGGAPWDSGPTISNTIYWQRGGAPANSRSSAGASGTCNWSVWGGAGGGSSGGTNSLTHGGRSRYGGSGGGQGGRSNLNNTVTLPSAGEGGNHDISPGVTPWGGGGGTAGNTANEDGGDGPDGSIDEGGQGGGGGGPGAGNSSSTARGGHGGRGGFPGGGSGGGGGSYSSTAAVNAIGGSGQPGADGLTVLTVLL